MTGFPETRPPASREPVADDRQPPGGQRVSTSRLWAGLLLAPAAWSVHMISETAINSFSCITGRGVPPPPGGQIGSGTWILLLALSVVLILAAIAGLVISLGSWRSVRTHSREHHELLETGEGRPRFMAIAGILVSTLFALLLIVNTIPLFLAPQCAP